jgi:hypothetical protein
MEDHYVFSLITSTNHTVMEIWVSQKGVNFWLDGRVLASQKGLMNWVSY